ncbi:MAG: bifunctional riboflavin kinase/FAD synthetase [Hyphomonadaceae bacterium]|nr:bifunctional riboflavin kinase/FAD synthetase [Hyphomonadaceae bacterium]
MDVYSAQNRLPDSARGASIALGNFDGVHLGHQAVLAAATAGADGRRAAAAVFEPHPRRFFKPDSAPFRLQTSGQRARALAACGADALIEITFDAALSQMSDEAFAREMIADRIGAGRVAVGVDFRFGKDRGGDTAALTKYGAQYGFSVEVVDAVDDGHHPDKVSSTSIRTALQAGDMDDAARLLGRPWAIEGEVISGMQRARGIGFATANVALGDYLRPMFGVYATLTDIGDGVWRAGVSNCGVKPTVGGVAEPLLETHIFDFSGDLYGRTVETQLVRFIRAERKFDSFEALTTQIVEDANAARMLLGD